MISFTKKSTLAFTLLELMIVIVIILILAGLIVGGAGYAQRASAENRARAEVRALELALQSYKLDNGAYPTGGVSGGVTNTNPNTYVAASTALYTALVGGPKIYFKDVPRGMLNNPSSPTHFLDPWGRPYGWTASTNATENPNFPEAAIWSAGVTPSNTATWISNF
jgi:prepilin-type N-terminal cleavage/methylation domain-containing protein